jgi:hypothetical protein
MSYYRADTSNSQGWRPGTRQLGYMSSGRQNGPNWKDVAAQHDVALRAQRHRSDAAYRASMARMHAVDRAARGDRSRVRVARLSGLGYIAIDLSGKMEPGAQYVFHFTVSGSVIGGESSIDPGNIAAAVATDSNFASPVASVESGGFSVAFTYAGQGSNVSGAASEMQDVINSHTFNGLGIFAKAAFLLAEGGPVGQPLINTLSNPSTTPGQQQQQQNAQPNSLNVPTWVWWVFGPLVGAKLIGVI